MTPFPGLRKRPRTRPRLAVLGERRITLDGRTVVYTLKRSPRSIALRLEIRRDGRLTVVIPRSYSVERVPEVLREKRRWILGKLDERGRAPAPEAGDGLAGGDRLRYLGETLDLVAARDGRRGGSVSLEGGRLVVQLGSADGSLDAAVERWYRERAAVLLAEKAQRYGGALGVSYNRITIRGQRTLWGSCSQKRNLSFNWKLLTAPEPVIDYVVVHELAHLAEMNHSKRFWSLVARHCPDWREQRRWLKQHEGALEAGAA